MNSTTTTTWPNQWASRYVPSKLHTSRQQTGTHVTLYYAPQEMRAENTDTTTNWCNDNGKVVWQYGKRV